MVRRVADDRHRLLVEVRVLMRVADGEVRPGALRDPLDRVAAGGVGRVVEVASEAGVVAAETDDRALRGIAVLHQHAALERPAHAPGRRQREVLDGVRVVGVVGRREVAHPAVGEDRPDARPVGPALEHRVGLEDRVAQVEERRVVGDHLERPRDQQLRALAAAGGAMRGLEPPHEVPQRLGDDLAVGVDLDAVADLAEVAVRVAAGAGRPRGRRRAESRRGADGTVHRLRAHARDPQDGAHLQLAGGRRVGEETLLDEEVDRVEVGEPLVHRARLEEVRVGQTVAVGQEPREHHVRVLVVDDARVVAAVGGPVGRVGSRRGHAQVELEPRRGAVDVCERVGVVAVVGVRKAGAREHRPVEDVHVDRVVAFRGALRGGELDRRGAEVVVKPVDVPERLRGALVLVGAPRRRRRVGPRARQAARAVALRVVDRREGVEPVAAAGRGDLLVGVGDLVVVEVGPRVGVRPREGRGPRVQIARDGLGRDRSAHRGPGVVVEDPRSRVRRQRHPAQGRAGRGVDHGVEEVVVLVREHDAPAEADPVGLREQDQPRDVLAAEPRLATRPARGARGSRRRPRVTNVVTGRLERLARPDLRVDRVDAQVRVRAAADADDAPVGRHVRGDAVVERRDPAEGLDELEVDEPVHGRVPAHQLERRHLLAVEAEQRLVVAQVVAHDALGGGLVRGRQVAVDVRDDARGRRLVVELDDRPAAEVVEELGARSLTGLRDVRRRCVVRTS